MADTAITKAIQQIKADSEYKVPHYQSACDKAIKILTDLLPYEREVIEKTFQDADKDRADYENGGKVKYLNSNHYFTKTYQND
jgi:hypothetical protein